MGGEITFNSINGKIKIEDDAITIDKSFSHMLNNGLQFSTKPNKIPLENIEKVYTDDKPGAIGKPKAIIKHSGKETEFRFHNKNNKLEIEGETESLNGIEIAEKLAELLAADKDKEIEVDTSKTEEDPEEEEAEGFLSKMSKKKGIQAYM